MCYTKCSCIQYNTTDGLFYMYKTVVICTIFQIKKKLLENHILHKIEPLIALNIAHHLQGHM